MATGGDPKALPVFDTAGPDHEVAERWRKWKQSFRYMVEGKGISDKQQRKALLLHTAGEDVQDIFDALEPGLTANPADVFEQAMTALSDHFSVQVNEPCECHKFRQMLQLDGETVAQFVVRLKSQAQFCNFSDTADQICDQLLQSVRDDELREKLLEKRNISLVEAMEIAQKREVAAAQAKTMRSQSVTVTAPVHAVRTRKPRPAAESKSNSTDAPSKSCFACGKAGHFARDMTCPARGQKCRKCKRVGHFAICCKSKSKASGAAHDVSEDTCAVASGKNSSTVSVVEEQLAVLRGDDMSYQLDAVEDVANITTKESSHDPIFLEVNINGKPVFMELDTGAKYSVIPETLWKAKWSDVVLNECSLRLCTYDGSLLPVVGQAVVHVQYSGKSVDCPLVVVKSGKYGLLGRNWLSALQPDWMDIIHNIHPVEPVSVERASSFSVIEEFPTVFAEKLGCIQGVEAEIHVKPDAVPKCWSARPVPYALRPAIDKEVDRLEGEGIIRKIDFAEWASPIVVETKKNGDVRLCVDFKVSINRYIDPQQHPIPSPTDLLATLAGGRYSRNLICGKRTRSFHYQRPVRSIVLLRHTEDCMCTLDYHLEFPVLHLFGSG